MPYIHVALEAFDLPVGNVLDMKGFRIAQIGILLHMAGEAALHGDLPIPLRNPCMAVDAEGIGLSFEERTVIEFHTMIEHRLIGIIMTDHAPTDPDPLPVPALEMTGKADRFGDGDMFSLNDL
jgi:hypothetical protein